MGDQRIMTVYKKIDSKLETIKSDKTLHQLTEFEKTLLSIQYKQESQQNSIDRSLSNFCDLFQNETNQIIQHIADLRASKKEQNESKSPSIFCDKPLSPISNKNVCNESFDTQSNLLLNAMNMKQQKTENIDQIIDSQNIRINELMMNEFVIILTNNLSLASDQSFNKLICVILKIMNALFIFDSSLNINEKIESILLTYRSE